MAGSPAHHERSPSGAELRDLALAQGVTLYALADLRKNEQLRTVLDVTKSPIALQVRQILGEYSENEGYSASAQDRIGVSSPVKLNEMWEVDGARHERVTEVDPYGFIGIQYSVTSSGGDEERRVEYRRSSLGTNISTWDREPAVSESPYRNATFRNLHYAEGDDLATLEARLRGTERGIECVDRAKFIDASLWRSLGPDTRKAIAVDWAQSLMNTVVADATESYVRRLELFGTEAAPFDVKLTERIGQYAPVLDHANQLNALFGFHETDPNSPLYKPYRRWSINGPSPSEGFDLLRTIRYWMMQAIEKANMSSAESYKASIERAMTGIIADLHRRLELEIPEALDTTKHPIDAVDISAKGIGRASDSRSDQIWRLAS